MLIAVLGLWEGSMHIFDFCYTSFKGNVLPKGFAK